MKSMLEYKGYHAKIEFDAEDMLFVGSVFGVSDSLNFHGRSINEITEMFHQTIDNYLELCAELGRQPDREFKGSFNVRIDPALHRQAALKAELAHMKLNQFVEQAIRSAVSRTESGPVYVFIEKSSTAGQRKLVEGAILPNDSAYRPANKQYDVRGSFGARPC